MDDLEAWVTGFIAAERDPDHIAAWVERTWAAVATDVPFLADDPELSALLRAAIGEHWQAFLDELSGGPTFELPPLAADLAREVARRHLDLSVLFAVYRSAQRASWAYATEIVRSAPDHLDHEDILVVFWTQAAHWLDASVEESLRLHQDEAALIRQRGDSQRFEAVRAVLAGEDREPRELSAALGGYAVTGHHVAVILTALTPEALTSLEPTARRIAGKLSARPPLLVRPSGREVWCWAPVGADLDAPPVSADGLDPAQLRVTVAGPHPGLDGFVLAHTEARAALPVALARTQPMTAYDDVAALTLIRADAAAAERFTRRVLGPLALAEHAHLRHTARVVLATPGSADEVAAELGLHKNTVRYRVTQIEKILGRPLRQRAGDLLLALDYADTFGAGVTRPT